MNASHTIQQRPPYAAALVLQMAALLLCSCQAVNVSSAAAFMRAVNDCARKLLVTQHLDLTGEPASGLSEDKFPDLLYPLRTTQSIQVRPPGSAGTLGDHSTVDRWHRDVDVV
jgi:hypothetical protein